MGKLPHAVLFACTRNVVRSPMAAALMRHRFGSAVYVASAGINRGERDAFALAVMQETGISMGAHVPSTLDELGDMSFDLIIALSPEALERAKELTRNMAVEIEYWPVPDPSADEGSREQRLSAYREVRDALDARIGQRFSS